ncbi:carboxypeptidase regulatory-like domain-containing protein [Candidatus Woesearchaeota archaeon]|nr:carboxypeptidase regulatory-like domain-containing protein [Candidatus Woesearchaeota archaeon]
MLKKEGTDKRQFYFHLFVLLFTSIILVSTGITYAQTVDIGCCTASDDINSYCVEFTSSTEAANAGCSNYVPNVACESTECGYMGCCSGSCSWEEKSNCPDSSFFAWQACSDVAACTVTCCEIDGQMFESVGYDSEASCNDQGGRFYNKPCAEVEPGGGFGTLQGYVNDSNGNPVSGATVYAGPYSSATDGEGKYKFDSIPSSYPNSYSIKAYFSGYQQSNDVTAVVVKDSTVNANAIIMESTSEALVIIKGKVLDQYGVAIPSAIVILNNEFSTYTDIQGYYTLSAQVADGSYELKATKAGFATSTRSSPISVVAGLRYDGEDFTLFPDSSGDQCGNGVLEGNEECEFPYLGACPGSCQSDCTCPDTCEELGNYCADVGYQCDNVNGQRINVHNDDCQTTYNQNIQDSGICCSSQPTALPECIYGEIVGNPDISYTDITGSGGDYCKCGNYIGDATDSSLYCCVVDGERKLQSNVCAPPGTVKGYVFSSTGPLNNVKIELSGIYQTRSNSSTGTNFNLANVAPGTYAIIAQKAGFKDFSGSVTVTSNKIINFNIDMQPIDGIDPGFSISLSHVKGYPYVKITITASDISAISYYNIYKDGNSDSNIIFRVGEEDIATTYEYVDTSTDWSTSYSYNVTAFSSFGMLDTDSSSLTTGDSACEGIIDTSQFCGSSLCFSTKLQSTCGINDESPYTYRLFCNDNNALSFPDSPSSSHCADVCVETSPGVTTCAGNELCREIGLPEYYGAYSADTGNIFGLYYFDTYGSESCESDASGYKFCYSDYFYSDIFDRMRGSYTTVDQCLACQDDGFCYNYQSEDACLRDNCRYGANYDTACKWQDTYPELGRGFCYSDDTANSNYCAMCDINNPVFYNQNCTQDICSQLGQCIADSQQTTCTACSVTTTCDQFSGNELACTGRQAYDFTGYPQAAGLTCNSSTVILNSDDACGIGFCKYQNGACIKDANDDGIYDCVDSGGDVSCDQDRSTPTTDLISPNYISMTNDAISFNVDDNQAITYYCFSDVNGYCCPDTIVNGGTVTVPNLDYDLGGIEEEKVLWFYSSSAYGNPEAIKNATITIDNLPPQLDVVANVKNSTLGMDLSDVIITVKSHETALNCHDSLTGPASLSQINNDAIDKERTVSYPGVVDGSYIYHITCEDIYGNVNNSVYVNIEVDRVKLIRDPKPNFVTLPYSIINFSVMTLDKRYSCYYNQISPLVLPDKKYPSDSPKSGDYIYEDKEIDLVSSDTYSYDILCYVSDAKQELADRTSQIFTIDKIAPKSSVFVQDDGGYVKIDKDRYYTNPLIKLNCTDPVQGPPREFGCSMMRYCLSTSSCVPTKSISKNTYEFRPSVNVSGKYYLCIESEDKGGNKETAYCETINLDLTPPKLQIDSPANNNVIGTSVLTFNGKWFDQIKPTKMQAKIVNERGFQINVNNVLASGSVDAGTFSGSANLNLLYAGLNTLTVVAIDASGNFQTSSVNFYYDVFPPEVRKAEIYGLDIVDKSEQYIIGGGSQGDFEIKLGYVLVTENQDLLRHHEYGFRLKPVLTANDYQYTDRNNIFPDEVDINATITSSTFPNLSIEQPLIANATGYGYYGIFDDDLEIGNYTITYNVSDEYGNDDLYSHNFYVNDTLEPYFEIKIFDDQGNNISEVKYGTYPVKIYSSEPIKNLHYLNFSVNGKSKYVELLSKNGTEINGLLTISPSDLDMRNLNQQTAIFHILGEDEHGLLGSIITTIKQFKITTAGPLQPVILTPDISSTNVHYSSSPNYTVEGMVYKRADVGLKDGDVILMKNTIVGDFTDGNWFIEGEATTTANTFSGIWENNRFGDEITYRDTDTINLHDYDNMFLSGRYFEFRDNPTPNRKLYGIQSRVFTNKDGVKDLYDIKSDRDFLGFEGFVPGTQFEDNIFVWDQPTPDGWFDVNVTLLQGANHFYARAFDDSNEGQYSQMFTIIYDTLPPELINVSPNDGTVTGSLDIPIYAYIDGTGSNISSYSLRLNGQQVTSTISYDEQGYARIEAASGLNAGDYIANIVATDMAGNTLSYQWSFTLDPSAPLSPDIYPAAKINDRTPLVEIEFKQDVILDNATIKGDGYEIDLTPLLSRQGNVFTYQITDKDSLPKDGDYAVFVEARKRVGNDYGTQGNYIQPFTLDRTPPSIIQTNDPISNPTLPVYISVKTDENALCRYGYYDVPFSQLPYGPRVEEYVIDHVLPVYELNKLDTIVYVRCSDSAGNVMTSSAQVGISVESLLFPAPKIYVPGDLVDVVKVGSYNVVGSTFDNPDPLMWVPNVNLQIGKSNLFYTRDVAFEQIYNTQSLPDVVMHKVNPSSGYTLDIASNAIIIADNDEIFQPGYYVDFAGSRRIDYRLYEIKSVIALGSSGNVMVSFKTLLPDDLDTSSELYVYAQEAPPGWFDYDLSLAEGNNFFYAAAVNKYGLGSKTEIYNLIKDTTDPILKDEFPRNGEIIAEENIEVSIVADGTYSQIVDSEFEIDELPLNAEVQYLKDYESKIKYDTTQSNGLHSIYVKAYDESGNSAETDWSFTIDASVPHRPIIKPDKPINDSTPMIDIQFPENVDIASAVLRSSDGSYELDFTNSINPTGNIFKYDVNSPLCSQDQEIPYEVHVRASKQGSNPKGYWYQPFVCDLKAPIITKIPVDVKTSKIPVKFYMETDEDSKCRYTERGPSISYFDMEYDLDAIYQKNHYVSAQTSSTKTSLYIRCIDVAGNAMKNSKVVTINQYEDAPCVCGDGQITCGHQCDGSNWGSIKTCNDYNSDYFGGFLTCDPVSCEFDTSSCRLANYCASDNDCNSDELCIDNRCLVAHCFNGVKDQNENGIDCGGNDCEACSAAHCTNGVQDYDEVSIDCGGSDCNVCQICGNGDIEPGETCDGTDFGRVRGCGDLPGFVDGTLTCDNSICHFDTSLCIPEDSICGNGVVEPGEQCEGEVDPQMGCTTIGFSGGTLTCGNDCQYDTSSCQGSQGVCGDGLLNVGEQCDSTNFGMTSCAYMNPNFASGSLGCDDNCMLTTDACVFIASCNDGLISPGEECDLGIGTAYCGQFDRFRGGALGCGTDCLYDTTSCIKHPPGCNDGIIDAGEQCEPNLPITLSCTKFDSYRYGEISCDSECDYDLSGCSKDPIIIAGCGNGLIDEKLGEQCESNIIVRTCGDLGFNTDGRPNCFAPGSANECQYDTLPCGGYICSGSETIDCNTLNPVYADGIAQCSGNFYDMSRCWSLEEPIISLTNNFIVSNDRIDITGTTVTARILEIYMNGVLVDTWENLDDSPSEHSFNFEDVYLSRSTATSDGLNKLTMIAYGVFPTINTTYERDILNDPVGPSITLVDPATGKVKSSTPTIKINTSKRADCMVIYDSLSGHDTQSMTTTDRITHSVTLTNSLLSDQSNPLTFECMDELGNTLQSIINIFVDTQKPIIEDVTLLTPNKYEDIETSADKKYIIFENLKTKMQVKSDSNVRCRYGFDTVVYDNMIDYSSTQNIYNMLWTTSNDIESSRENLSVVTICKDEAGWLSDPYTLELHVDPDAPIIITSLMGNGWVKTSKPNINISTNRPSSCTISYRGNSKQMIRNVIDYRYNYHINTDAFGIDMIEDASYDFRVTCSVDGIDDAIKDLTLRADYTPPYIEVLSPANNPDHFSQQRIIIEATTEALSSYDIYLDDFLDNSSRADSGSITYHAYLDEGKNLITISVKDKAGNTNATTLEVYYVGTAVLPKINSIYPSDGSVLQSISAKKMIAYVWTVYGADLDLSGSEIILKNQDNSRIYGNEGFERDTTGSNIGNYTYTLDSNLDDGNYTWEIQVADKLGNVGKPVSAKFMISKEIPLISLVSPIVTNSDSSDRDYLTNLSSFELRADISSTSEVISATYDLRKFVKGEFKSVEDGDLNLYPEKDGFKNLITLEPLSKGQVDAYQLIIEVSNKAGHTANMKFTIYYDLESPIPTKFIIE